jgi:hypothetical protein
MATRAQAVPALSAEFDGADLGDERLDQRLGLLADCVAERPGESFPKVLDDAELEAAYRFFRNERVTPEGILAPHFRQTARRAAAAPQVLVVHDTTQFEFGGHVKREGLGRIIRPGQGFFGHFSLATSADGTRKPLGLLGLETVFRLDKSIWHQAWTSPHPHIPGPKGERHPARRYRIAKLSFAAGAVEIPRTGESRKARSTSLGLNIVHVFERHPPRG